MRRIYVDYAATTPMHEDVIDVMKAAMEDYFGNPSSIHHFGRESRKRLDEARDTMAKSIGANDQSIIFTSGGTEANNLAIFGAALSNREKGNHIITTAIEHHAVLHPCEQLEKEGFDVTYLPVDESGIVSIEDVKKALRDDTILVSIMYVNNETGMIQPVKEIASLLNDHQALFHTDAVQAYGMLNIDVLDLNVDLLTTSAHKIYGPKGIGFLYKRDDVHLQKLLYGGEQERKWRSGTENLISIAGFQKAVQLLDETLDERIKNLNELYKTFLQTLAEEDIEFIVNGEAELKNRVPNIINISFPGTEVESFLTNLDLSGIAASSGSACTAGSIDPSHVLKAMYGEDSDRLYNSIRFSFGVENTIDDVKTIVRQIKNIIQRLK